jgi:hypothetical protein
MMSKASEFDNILDGCLERVIKGETVEACLAGFPDYAAELEPLLRTALATREAVAIGPRPEFRERAGYEFQAAIREMAPQVSGGFFGWFPRWATVVTVVIVVLLALSGTVAAAFNSLPDSPLYQVKLATETVRLAFAPSPLGKAELYARFADERVAEIVGMAEKGNIEQVERATERMNDQLIAMADLTSPGWEAAAEAQTFTVEAPVPAPMLAPEPTPAPTPAPAAETPPPVAETTPPPAVVEEAPVLTAPKATAPREDVGKAEVSGEGEGETDAQARLRTIIAQQAEENSQALQDVLARVPESVRQALLRAIEVADTGYGQVLANLD